MGRLGIIASFQPTHCTSDMSMSESRLGPERIKGAYAWRSLIECVFATPPSSVRVLIAFLLSYSGGAPFALGSDFPVEGVNPFFGIYAAVARKWVGGEKAGDSPHGEGGWFVLFSSPPFPFPSLPAFLPAGIQQRSKCLCQLSRHCRYPEQRLTALEALRGFTTAAAYASFSSHQVGSLEIGKFADFIIVDGDPLVLGTEVEGETVKERRTREKRLREMKVSATVVQGRAVFGGL